MSPSSVSFIIKNSCFLKIQIESKHEYTIKGRRALKIKIYFTKLFRTGLIILPWGHMNNPTTSFPPKHGDCIQTAYWDRSLDVFTSELQPGAVREVVLAERNWNQLNNLATHIMKLLHAKLKPSIFNFLTLL